MIQGQRRFRVEDSGLKDVLRQIATALTDMRANLVLLAEHVDQGSGLLKAAEDKTRILGQVEPLYAALNKAIDAL
jgi:hypothetical protein